MTAAFTIDAAAFKTLLATVAPAVMRKTNLPSLTGVLLTAEGDALTAKATDCEIGIVATAPADAAASGGVLVAHDLLADLVGRLSGPVSCAVEKQALAVAAPPVDAEVRTVGHVDDFPAIPLPAAEATVLTVPANVLKTAIGRVDHAADDSPFPHRSVFTGVHLGVVGGVLTLCATDGHRLAIVDVPGVGTHDSPWPIAGVLVHHRAIKALAKLLSPSLADAELRLTFRSEIPDALTVVCGAWSWTSRLIDGLYPDLRRYLPTSTPTTATVATKDLRDAVATVRPFARRVLGDAGHAMIGVGVAAAGTLTVSGADADKGEATQSIPAHVAGPTESRNFDAGYLAAAVAAPTGDELVLAFGTIPNGAPMLTIRETDGSDLWAVLPIEKGGPK